MFCQPTVPVAVYTNEIEGLMRQRDFAEKTCKETIEDLKLMTEELKAFTSEMKAQSDAIEEHLNVIEAQKETIEQLEARIATLEKDDPDLSIYDDTMSCHRDDLVECECNRRNELDAVNSAVEIVLVFALCVAVLAFVNYAPLSHTDL